MSDRELLELAAKAARAAGLNIIDSEAGPLIRERTSPFGFEIHRLWYPRESNGDAFQLAVALELIPANDKHIGMAWINDSKGDLVGRGATYLECDLCPYSATRLAIFRAAAEIGKAMP